MQGNTLVDRHSFMMARTVLEEASTVTLRDQSDEKCCKLHWTDTVVVEDRREGSV